MMELVNVTEESAEATPAVLASPPPEPKDRPDDTNDRVPTAIHKGKQAENQSQQSN